MTGGLATNPSYHHLKSQGRDRFPGNTLPDLMILESFEPGLVEESKTRKVLEGRSRGQSGFDTKEPSEQPYPYIPPKKLSNRREHNDRERNRPPFPDKPNNQPSLSPPSRTHARSGDRYYHSPGPSSRNNLNTRPVPSAKNETFQSKSGHPQPFTFSDSESIFAEFLRGEKEYGGGETNGDFSDSFGEKRESPAPASRGEPESNVTIVEKSLPITLEDIFHGATKKFKIKRKALDLATGLSSTQDRILDVPIKRGLKPGSKIKFAGVGDQVDGGSQDLHFIVEEVCRSSQIQHDLY